MKLVKVRIRRGGEGEDMMVYPPRYRAGEVDRNGVGPTNLNPAGCVYSGGIGRGDVEEWCIIALDDALADEYATDPGMEIVTEAQADADMESWRVANGLPATTISDPELVRHIDAKQARGDVLTKEEQDALDPAKPARGVNNTRRPVRQTIGARLTR